MIQCEITDLVIYRKFNDEQTQREESFARLRSSHQVRDVWYLRFIFVCKPQSFDVHKFRHQSQVSGIANIRFILFSCCTVYRCLMLVNVLGT